MGEHGGLSKLGKRALATQVQQIAVEETQQQQQQQQSAADAAAAAAAAANDSTKQDDGDSFAWRKALGKPMIGTAVVIHTPQNSLAR